MYLKSIISLLLLVMVSAEALKPNVKYSVVIGIMGLDKKYRSKYFSANVDSSLKDDSNGHLKVFEEGACPIESKIDGGRSK